MLGGTGYSKVYLYDSAGEEVEDYFTFTVREEEQLRVDFNRVLDCPDKTFDDGSRKRYFRGYRVHIEINFLFDDHVSTVSDNGRNCQKFLQDLHNHTGKIKVIPHSDKTIHAYWVLLENDWKFDYAFSRWIGWSGVLIFEGTAILSSINLEDPA